MILIMAKKTDILLFEVSRYPMAPLSSAINFVICLQISHVVFPLMFFIARILFGIPISILWGQNMM